MLGERVATTSEINHIIEANKENADTDKDEDGKVMKILQMEAK